MDDVLGLLDPLREGVIGLTVRERGAFPGVDVCSLAPLGANGVKGCEDSGEGFVVEGLVVGGYEDFLAFLAQFDTD